MPLTNYLDQSLASLAFGGVVFTTPTTLYVALSTTTPTQIKGNLAPFWNFTEPTTGAYVRVGATNNTTNFVGTVIANGYQINNGIILNFPTATGSWGTVSYAGVFDAATSGNLLGFGPLSANQTINTGDTASFAINALTISLN